MDNLKDFLHQSKYAYVILDSEQNLVIVSDVDEIEALNRSFPYGYFVAEESKQWVIENIKDGFLIVMEYRNIDHTKPSRTVVLFKDDIDATAFKLRWIG